MFLQPGADALINLDPRSTALVLIDLQNGILGRKLEPISSETLVERAKALAQQFRTAGAPVVLVNVIPRPDDARRVDEPSPIPKVLPESFADLAPSLAREGDIRITKRSWGALSNPDLDPELKRRGVRTIVLGGVATQFGVELTARQAWELGYELVVAEDVTTSTAIEPHERTMRQILPRIARVADSASLVFARA